MNQSVEWNVMSGFNVALASIFPIHWSIQQDCMAWRDVFNLWGGIPWIKSDDCTPKNKQQNTPLKNSGKGKTFAFPFFGSFWPILRSFCCREGRLKKCGLYGIPKNIAPSLATGILCQQFSASQEESPRFWCRQKKTSRASHFFCGGLMGFSLTNLYFTTHGGRGIQHRDLWDISKKDNFSKGCTSEWIESCCYPATVGENPRWIPSTRWLWPKWPPRSLVNEQKRFLFEINQVMEIDLPSTFCPEFLEFFQV